MKKYKKFKNLTGHTVNILNQKGGLIQIPPYTEDKKVIQSRIPHFNKNKQVIAYLNIEDKQIPIFKHNYNECINPPNVEDKETLFIVSAIVKNMFKDYENVVSVDSPQKDGERNVVFALGFRVNG